MKQFVKKRYTGPGNWRGLLRHAWEIREIMQNFGWKHLREQTTWNTLA